MHDAHVEDRVMVILVFRMAAKVLRFPFLRGAGHQLIIYFMRHLFKTLPSTFVRTKVFIITDMIFIRFY